MASEKPSMILASRTDMTGREIAALSDGEAWRIIYSLPRSSNPDDRLQICFTGFTPSQKEVLMGLAEENDMKVVMSVTKKLNFLCVGDNAGPKKLEKAISQGIQVLTESQYVAMIETGEIPASQN